MGLVKGKYLKINWKLRFGNRVTLTAVVLAVIALVYQILGIMKVVPAVSETQIVQIAGMVINLLVLLGVITDPTTSGVSDSTNALTYVEPKKSGGE